MSFVYRSDWTSLAMIGLLIALAASCSGSDQGEERLASEPHFAGFIAQIEWQPEDDVIGRILAESHADKLVTRRTVTVTKGTRFFEQDSAGFSVTSFTSLDVGSRVQFWFVGARGKLDRSGTTAQQVVVIPR